jgi:hypothetical protein
MSPRAFGSACLARGPIGLGVGLAALFAACVSDPVDESPPKQAFRQLTPHEAIVEEIALQRAVHQPDDHHLRLDAFVGQWLVLVHSCPPGVDEPVLVARGSARIAWILDRRYLDWDIHLDVGETSNSVKGNMGYDVVAGQYEALWISDITTGMRIIFGNGNPKGRGLVLVGTGMRGGQTVVTGRSVMRFVGADSFVIERYGAEGEAVTQRSTYVRRTGS